MGKPEITDPYGFVYITTCLVNGKRYLGQRVFAKGWKTYIGSGVAFTQAVKRYGKENFTREIVHVCYSQEELNKAEYDLSVCLNVVESDDFYNLVFGGGTNAGWNPSPETREKIGAANRGENSGWYGKKHTEEQKRKIGAARKGMKFPDEWRKNISAGRAGVVVSEETREKLRAANSGVNNPMYGRQQSEKGKTAQSRPIMCVETGIKYYGIREADRKTGITRANIWRALNGKQKTAGGFTWVYVETGGARHGT